MIKFKRNIILLFLSIIICLTLQGTVYGDTVSKVKITVDRNYDYALEVFNELNNIRVSYGLKPFTFNSNLQTVAMRRSAESAILYDHVRPDGSNWYKIYPKKTYVAENLFACQDTPKQVIKGWMNSPCHRANILSKNYTSSGIGCVFHNGNYYWAQSLAKCCGNENSTGGIKEKTYLIKTKNLNVNINLEVNKKLLAVGEETPIRIFISNPGLNCQEPLVDILSGYKLISSNDNIISFKDNKIIANSKGTAIIYAKFSKSKSKKIMITVT